MFGLIYTARQNKKSKNSFLLIIIFYIVFDNIKISTNIYTNIYSTSLNTVPKIKNNSMFI